MCRLDYRVYRRNVFLRLQWSGTKYRGTGFRVVFRGTRARIRLNDVFTPNPTCKTTRLPDDTLSFASAAPQDLLRLRTYALEDERLPAIHPIRVHPQILPGNRG